MKSHKLSQQVLGELLGSQHEAIRLYKRMESEKQGRHIEHAEALESWMQNHFPTWKRQQWQKALADTKNCIINHEETPSQTQARCSYSYERA